MWSWTLNWNQVRHDLLVGSCPRSAQDILRIRSETAASALLCLQSDQCFESLSIDYENHRELAQRIGLEMRRVPMRDFDVTHQQAMLLFAVRVLVELLGQGHRVYVHCTAGLGRAPLVLVGYLILAESMAAEEAFELVKSRRSGAVPSPEALAGCHASLVDLHWGRIAQRAWLKYRERTTLGSPGSAVSDWLEAERHVLRSLARGAE